MNRKKKQYIRDRCSSGFTLTEVMISILVVMVLATGALGYQYGSTRDVKISEVQAGATRIAMLLLENWKGQQGNIDFDHVDALNSAITIETSTIGPDVPDNTNGISLTPLGSYQIVFSNIYYFITLSYEQETESEPMLLNATVTWRRDYSQGSLTGDEPFVRYSTYAVTY
jgi:type II secretory pathway pseudopilin PulG